MVRLRARATAACTPPSALLAHTSALKVVLWRRAHVLECEERGRESAGSWGWEREG